MPRKYNVPEIKAAKPELKPSKDTKKERILGKISLFANAKKLSETYAEQAKELREELIELLGVAGVKHDSGLITYEDGGYTVELQKQDRETLNIAEAMSVINSIPNKEVAEQYIVQTTDKNMLAAAFMAKDIDEESLKRCFDTKPVYVLKVKGEDD